MGWGWGHHRTASNKNSTLIDDIRFRSPVESWLGTKVLHIINFFHIPCTEHGFNLNFRTTLMLLYEFNQPLNHFGIRVWMQTTHLETNVLMFCNTDAFFFSNELTILFSKTPYFRPTDSTMVPLFRKPSQSFITSFFISRFFFTLL